MQSDARAEEGGARLVAPFSAGRALPQADHVARRRPFDEADHVPRHGRHDPLVLVGIAVAIIDVGHLTGPVIGDAVHRVAAEAEPGDPRQAGSPQIVRRGALDLELGDQFLQQNARLLAARSSRGGCSISACAGSDSQTR